MTQKTSEHLYSVVFIIALVASLLVALPLKGVVKSQVAANYYLCPLAESAGMIASFFVFLLVFAAVTAPVALIWSWYNKPKAQTVQPQQVTYGYQTPVPR